jgi:hypothetical protein
MVTRLSVDDAARYLGISRPTVKRRLKSGSLRGVQERTPSGFKWYVIVEEAESPGGVAGGAPAESPRESLNGVAAESPHEPPGESAASPRVSPQAALLAQRAEEMARYTRELLAPYVKRIEEQAEEIGALKAQLAAATPAPGTNGVAHAQAAAETASTPAPAETASAAAPGAAAAPGVGAARPWWRRTWAWITGDQAAPGAAAG